MSHRNYRKLLREKEEHIAVLTKKREEKLNYVSPLTVEEQEAKTNRINLFQDLRTACNLELGYYHRYLSYMEIPTYDNHFHKTGTEKILNPLVQYVNDLMMSSKTNFGFLERKAVAHLIQNCKKSLIFDNATSVHFLNNDVLVGDRVRKEAKDAITAIFNMARYKNNWIRNPDLWKPTNGSAEMQLNSLIKHLFAKYPMPDFLNDVWTKDDEASKIHQEWYVNLGNGENIRNQKGLPIPLTKKVAHYMMQAPVNCNVNQAIRWGQVIAMGGTNSVAYGVNATRLSQGFDNDEFWLTVVKFFIDCYPFLEINQYGPIYDYVNNQKFIPVRAGIPIPNMPNLVGVPPQPNFSMRGRDPNTLLVAVQRWHNEIAAERGRYNNFNTQIKNEFWNSCGINGLSVKEKGTTYEITELLTTDELWVEGKAMHHCVASYSSYCASGSSAIYSLTAKTEDKDKNVVIERLVTLEIKPSNKEIIQARKLQNAKPTGEDMRIIKMWASKVGLKFSRFIN